MSNLQFDEQHGPVMYSRFERTAEPPKIIRFLVDHNLAKNEKHAGFILLGVVVVSIIVSFYLLHGAISPPSLKSI